MSFWNLGDDTDVSKESTKEFDGGGGNMEPIPEGSSVLAMPDDAKWAEDRDGNEYLSIRWTVLKPEVFLNRKVFQKLWVTDDDPRAKDPDKKRDKAKRMLAAIDANAGGKLGKKASKPTDDDLAIALVSKQMVLRLGLWEMQGDNGAMSGNWVQAISGKDKPVAAAETKRTAPAKPAQTRFADVEDDDVPF